jgi:APA family basic amino acid/polyamine antiporter
VSVSAGGSTRPTDLRRELGFADAVFIGLGAMLGAGVFVAFAPAAQSAGIGLLPALALAGGVAWCNATSTAALASVYPRAGGAYLYGRARLGPVWGFLAGWGFVIGKTAGCAAMAMTAGAYAWPSHPRPVAIAVAAALAGLNCVGIARTALVNRLLVTVTLGVLGLVVSACLFGGAAESGHLHGGPSFGFRGVVQAAGLLFFAFAGYARVATLGEEVRDPARTIPRAVSTALGIVLAVYFAVGLGLLLVLGPRGIAASAAPLRAAVAAGSWHWAAGLVRLGAVTACCGVLLSSLAGIGRTTLAMARDDELPRDLARVHPLHGVPQRAQIAVGAVVVGLVAFTDIRGAIGFSGFAVLGYYAVGNLAAWTLPAPRRTGGRVIAAAGLVGCLLLAGDLPADSVLAGLAVFGVGLALRAIRRARGACRGAGTRPR